MSEIAVAPLELIALTRRLRGSLASLRAAAETLQSFPGMDETKRLRLLDVVVEEAEQLGEHLETIDRLAASTQSSDEERRPLGLEDLLSALHQTIEASGLECELALPTADFEIEVLLTAIERAIAGFATRLHRDLAVRRCRLSAVSEELHVLIDLAWRPAVEDRARLHEWQGAALEASEGASGGAGAGAAAGGLRTVARAHDGEVWFLLDRDGEWAHLRLLLSRLSVAGRQED